MKFSSKFLIKKVLEESVMDLNKKPINRASTNRDFRSIHRMVATYKRTKKGSSFTPKKKNDDDVIYTKTSNLYITDIVASINVVYKCKRA